MAMMPTALSSVHHVWHRSHGEQVWGWDCYVRCGDCGKTTRVFVTDKDRRLSTLTKAAS